MLYGLSKKQKHSGIWFYKQKKPPLQAWNDPINQSIKEPRMWKVQHNKLYQFCIIMYPWTISGIAKKEVMFFVFR